MKKAAFLEQLDSNHSCSFTSALLIAMQLQVQLGGLADLCHSTNCNQLYKDIWFWMTENIQRELFKELFYSRQSKAAVCENRGLIDHCCQGTKLLFAFKGN